MCYHSPDVNRVKPLEGKEMSARNLALATSLLLFGTLLAAPQEGRPSGPAGAEPVVPKTRKFNVVMRFAYNNIPKNIQGMQYWFPLPIQNDHQQIHNQFSHAPYTSEVNTAPDTGNVIMHMEGTARGGVPMQVKISFDAERIEDLRNTFEPPADSPSKDEEKKVMERWLQPSTVMVIDKKVRSKASKIVSGKKMPLDKARAIYDWVVDNLTYLENAASAPGAGFGNLAFVLDKLEGNSMDFSAAFVGLCRAEGIPARSIIGFRIPKTPDTGVIKDYHGWAEFYLQGIGWIPVDPAAGKRTPARRKYYFGALDPDRLAISIGRDIVLIPPQAGDPLNYLVNPYWEGDTKPMPTPYVEIKYTNLEKIPEGLPDEAVPIGGQTVLPPAGGGGR